MVRVIAPWQCVTIKQFKRNKRNRKYHPVHDNQVTLKVNEWQTLQINETNLLERFGITNLVPCCANHTTTSSILACAECSPSAAADAGDKVKDKIVGKACPIVKSSK